MATVDSNDSCLCLDVSVEIVQENLHRKLSFKALPPPNYKAPPANAKAPPTGGCRRQGGTATSTAKAPGTSVVDEEVLLNKSEDDRDHAKAPAKAPPANAAGLQAAKAPPANAAKAPPAKAPAPVEVGPPSTSLTPPVEVGPPVEVARLSATANGLKNDWQDWDNDWQQEDWGDHGRDGAGKKDWNNRDWNTTPPGDHHHYSPRETNDVEEQRQNHSSAVAAGDSIIWKDVFVEQYIVV